MSKWIRLVMMLLLLWQTPMVRYLLVVSSLLSASTLQAGDPPIVVVIGGNHSDPSPAQLAGRAGRGGNSGLWRLKGDLKAHEGLAAEYFNWNGTRAGHIDGPDPGGAREIARLIRKQHRESPESRVVLVGNSWGGHTAWQVSHLLNGGTIDEQLGSQHSLDPSTPARLNQPTGNVVRTRFNEPAAAEEDQSVESSDECAHQDQVIGIDLIVFLDPSSFGRGTEPQPTMLPSNVKQAVNFHTHNSFGWKKWLDDPRVENVDLGDPANGFLKPGGAKYDSLLNWRAHVSAEWDEQIHTDIRRRIALEIANEKVR